VDEHDAAVDRFQPGANAVGPLGTSGDECTHLKASKGGGSLLFLPGTDHDPDGGDARVADQRLDRMAEQGLVAEQAKLLGRLAAHAGTRSGGYDEGGDGLHGSRLARSGPFL
jgi:hypothetical protein